MNVDNPRHHIVIFRIINLCIRLIGLFCRTNPLDFSRFKDNIKSFKHPVFQNQFSVCNYCLHIFFISPIFTIG